MVQSYFQKNMTRNNEMLQLISHFNSAEFTMTNFLKYMTMGNDSLEKTNTNYCNRVTVTPFAVLHCEIGPAWSDQVVFSEKWKQFDTCIPNMLVFGEELMILITFAINGWRGGNVFCKVFWKCCPAILSIFFKNYW